MKTISLTAACLILATMSTSVALAQHAGPGRDSVDLQRGRAGTNDNLLRESMREVERAHDMLQRALPIYHGHRVEAMQDCRDAQKQIAQLLRYDRRHDDGQWQGRNGGDNESPSRYSREEVRRSNGTLKKAAEILEDARRDLQKAGGDNRGHQAEAIKQIDQALRNIHQALASTDRRR